jgi:hypothetical protein
MGGMIYLGMIYLSLFLCFCVFLRCPKDHGAGGH